MKKSKLSMLGAGFAMALAAMTGSAQMAQASTQGLATSINEMKATPAKHSTRRQSIEETIGGLPLVSYIPDYGMSPKEYGMRYGNGASRKGKSNRLRYGHNAKVGRR